MRAPRGSRELPELLPVLLPHTLPHILPVAFPEKVLPPPILSFALYGRIPASYGYWYSSFLLHKIIGTPLFSPSAPLFSSIFHGIISTLLLFAWLIYLYHILKSSLMLSQLCHAFVYKLVASDDQFCTCTFINKELL